MYKLLLIDDSPEIYDLLCVAVKPFAQVTLASSYNAAIETLSSLQFDLILIDIHLPDGDGYEICSLLENDEKHFQTGKMFLSAKKSVEAQIMGLRLGADDFISKPIDVRLLRAKLESKLKWLKKSTPDRDIIRFDDFKVDLTSQRIYKVNEDKEKVIDLTPNEFRILSLFIKNNDVLFSRDQILNHVWGDNISIVDRVVDIHISSLRKKLGSSSKLIQTVYGMGYRFANLERAS